MDWLGRLELEKSKGLGSLEERMVVEVSGLSWELSELLIWGELVKLNPLGLPYPRSSPVVEWADWTDWTDLFESLHGKIKVKKKRWRIAFWNLGSLACKTKTTHTMLLTQPANNRCPTERSFHAKANSYRLEYP